MILSAGYPPVLGCFSHSGCTLWDPESTVLPVVFRCATNGVCLIRSKAPLVFKRNYIFAKKKVYSGLRSAYL